MFSDSLFHFFSSVALALASLSLIPSPVVQLCTAFPPRRPHSVVRGRRSAVVHGHPSAVVLVPPPFVVAFSSSLVPSASCPRFASVRGHPSAVCRRRYLPQSRICFSVGVAMVDGGGGLCEGARHPQRYD